MPIVPFPPEWSYEDASTEGFYTAVPTGILEPNKAIRKEVNFWIDPEGKKIQKQKTLILCDWTAAQWQGEFYLKLKQDIEYALSQDYVIYVVQNDKLKKLTLDNINFLDSQEAREKIKPKTKEFLIEAAKEKGIAPDRVEFITYQHTHFNEEDRNKVALKDIVESSHSIKKIEDSVLSFEGKQEIVVIENAAHHPKIKQLVKLKNKKRESNPTESLYVEMVSGKTQEYVTDVENSLEKYSENLKTIQFSFDKIINLNKSFEFKKSAYPALLNFSLTVDDQKSNTIFWKLLVCILAKADSLEVLSITYSKLDTSNVRILIGSELKSLKELNLSNSWLEEGILRFLLNSRPNLTKLDLNKCTLKDWDHNWDHKLEKLTWVDFSNTNITVDCLNRIINESHNLRTLSIKNCTEVDWKDFKLEKEALKNLKEADFSDTEITHTQLGQILNQAVNLKSLKLYRCQNIRWSKLNKILLKKIKHLDLSYASINDKYLDILIKNTTNLKSLNLTACSNLHGNSVSPEFFDFFSELEELNISLSNVSTEFLEKILLKAKNLKKLTILYAPNIDFSKLSASSIKSLKKLEELNIWNNEISGNFLQKIIKSSPRLKTLKLNACYNLSLKSCVSIPSLKILEAAKLESIDEDFFEKILHSSPRLKILIIGGKKSNPINIIDKIKIPHQSFRNIVHLDVSHANLSHVFLENLVKHAPKLNILKLAQIKPNTINWRKLSNDFYFNISNIETLHLRFSDISVECFEKILSIEFTPNLKYIYISGCQNIAIKNLSRKTQDRLKTLKAVCEKPQNYQNNLLQFRSFNSDNLSNSSDKPQNNIKPPPYDTDEHLNKKKEDPNFEYQFDGAWKHKNIYDQKMVIERLSRWLSLKDNIKYKDLIAKIQKGICRGLSYYYIEESFDSASWLKIVRAMHDWNGEQGLLEADLNSRFETILGYIENYQFGNNSLSGLIGDNPIKFLKSLKNNQSVIVNNPWHATVLQLKDNRWHYFNVNFDSGEAKVFPEGQTKELIEHIKSDIGNVLLIDHHQEFKPVKFEINDPAEFIKNGGLLCLDRISSEQRTQLVSQLSPILNKNSENDYAVLYKALFLRRNLDCVPAWMIGLGQPESQEFLIKLIETFIVLKKENYLELFKRSVEELSEEEKLKYYDLLSLYITHSPPVIKEILSVLQKEVFLPAPIAPAITNFSSPTSTSSSTSALTTTSTSTSTSSGPVLETVFKTWLTNNETPKDTAIFFDSLFSNSGHNKILLECNSKNNLEDQIIALEKYCQSQSRPFIYIHAPEDLRCKGDFIVYQDGLGVVQSDTGGSLNDFLEKTKDNKNSPMILINYNNFTAEKIVEFNTILDPVRKVDGVTLPEQMTVLGVMDISHPEAYQETDFYGRFDKIENAKSVTNLADYVSSSSFSLNSSAVNIHTDSETYIIDLYESPILWEVILLGRYVPERENLVFRLGEFTQAINHHKNLKKIIFRNPPINCQKFDLFLRQIKLRNKVDTPAGEIDLPVDIQFEKVNDYSYCPERFEDIIKKTKENKNENDFLHKESVVLNPNTLFGFFEQFDLDNETGKASARPGLIEQHKDKTLNIYLTRPLSKANEVRFLDACHKNKVTLNINTVFANSEENQHKVFVSKDLDWALDEHILKIVRSVHKIIDVSELKSTSLLENIVLKDPKLFHFKRKICAVQKALENGETVVLKGVFSDELVDKLAPILLASASASKGKLIILTENEQQFGFYPATQKLEVPEVVAASKEPWVKTKTKLKYKQQYENNIPNFDPEIFWKGLTDIAFDPMPESDDLANAKAIADKVDADRLKSVNRVLNHEPYVWIGGKSGVGKTTFADKVLSEQYELSHYHQREELLSCLKPLDNNSAIYSSSSSSTSSSNKKKLLIIDEANIGNQNWSIFEGLFADTDPKGIIVDGEFRELEAKIVFMANPSGHGNRKIPSLVKRHGNAIIFDPLSPEYIYDRILKPIFVDQNIVDPDLQQKIAKSILKTYVYFCNISKEEILISPRELESMALLTLQAMSKNPGLDPERIAQHYAYTIGKTLVPKKYVDSFEDKFGKNIAIPSELKLKDSDDFILTPSRQSVAKQINDFLELRESEIKRYNASHSLLYKKRGLGGIVIEGEPRNGKSELIKALFLQKNYKENQDYYSIPASWSVQKKADKLKQAFREGKIVFMDESNCGLSLERLKNDLLSGKDPDDPKGKNPVKPGFLFIGTQNPSWMKGRRAASTADKRRTLKLVLPPYTHKELKHILAQKGCPLDMAEKIILQFESDRDYAIKNNKKPIPVLKDLINFAKPYFTKKVSVPNDILLESEEDSETDEETKETKETKDKNKEKPDMKEKEKIHGKIDTDYDTVKQFQEYILSYNWQPHINQYFCGLFGGTKILVKEADDKKIEKLVPYNVSCFLENIKQNKTNYKKTVFDLRSMISSVNDEFSFTRTDETKKQYKHLLTFFNNKKAVKSENKLDQDSDNEKNKTAIIV